MSSRRAKKAPLDLIDWEAVAMQDDECGGERGFKLKDKIRNEKFEESCDTMVEMMTTGRELNVKYMQASGFTKPILVWVQGLVQVLGLRTKRGNTQWSLPVVFQDQAGHAGDGPQRGQAGGLD